MILNQFEGRKVLVLAAHPDDEIACSGTIANLSDLGAIIKLVVFSRCEDVGNLEPELLRAYQFLGIREIYWDTLPNKQLPNHRQTILNILDTMRTDAELVLTPARSDIHQDHAAVTAEAIRVFKWQTILGYEHPQNTVGSACWNAYVELDQTYVDTKVTHAGLYRSQSGKPYMNPDYIRGFAAVRGMQIGAGYAEAFEVIRMVFRKDATP